jgi:predicted secreted hydrolase
VIQGQNGVSQKGEGQGCASHYISLTRLGTAGEIELAGQQFQVTGTAWMDHEFFTHQLEADQIGWDWMSMQFADNTELMLFQIRRKDGSIDPHSAGTFVNAGGDTIHLGKEEFRMDPTGIAWTSPVTHAIYPMGWKISVPKLNIVINCSTSLPSQELASSVGFTPSYWEGSVDLAGTRDRASIGGVGYLEMTGYDRPVEALR